MDLLGIEKKTNEITGLIVFLFMIIFLIQIGIYFKTKKGN
jgi:hypothetical protein